MTKNEQALSGPYSQHYLEAWKMANPTNLSAEASLEEISGLANSYEAEQLAAVHRGVTAKFYEILEVEAENYDQNGWNAEISSSQNNPRFDAIFVNESMDRAIEINFKLTESRGYIESHLARYPDIPVVAPPEIAEKINNPMVWSGEYSYSDVYEISDENFESLLQKSLDHWIYLGGLAGAGVGQLAIALAPFISAFTRGKIDAQQLRTAFTRFLPEISTRTANRMVMFAALGPVYAMALTAKIALRLIKNEVSEPGSDLNVDNPDLEETKHYSRRDVITLFWPRGASSLGTT